MFFCFAERTGLEPAISAVTGQRSNQLNYRSKNYYIINLSQLLNEARTFFERQSLE